MRRYLKEERGTFQIAKVHLLNLGLFISIIFFLYLASTYLTLSQQFLVGWGLLIALSFLKRIPPMHRPPGRFFFLLLATFISLRYWCWRTFDTLIYTGFFDCIGMIFLYLAEAYSITIHFLGMFVNIWPLERKPVLLPDNPELLPTVDIFIPTYNEPEDIVRVTTIACTQIDYPKEKLCIYILDDGSTVARRNNSKTAQETWERYHRFKKMAAELGVNYLTRENNEHAKAGNINSALKYTDGELILILDCDHVPTRDILKNTVGCFLKDKKLFLVQTPHFFINPDPVEKNLATFLDVPSENEMFYGAIQLGLDFWNSSFFCGSAALLRRKYLEEIGGIAGKTVTEDTETALSLHAKGYNSVYINRPMICGLSPDTFDAFILQRSRWAQGMVQIFILKNPLLTRGFKIYQRLCYSNSCLFWFFGLARFVFFLAPAAYLLFGLKIYNASVPQVLAYAIPHVLSCLLVADFLYGKVRWPFFSELYETAQTLFLIPAIISAIINPKAPTFKVTPKGVTLTTDTISPLAGPFYLMFFIILATFPAAVIKWFSDPVQRDTAIICAVWSALNFFTLLACLGAVWEKRQVRRSHRAWTKGKVNLFLPRLNLFVTGKIKDISLTGIGLNVPLSLSLKAGEKIFLDAKDRYGHKYKFQAKLVRIKKKKNFIYCGCEFIVEKNALFSLVRFVYGDSQRWVEFLEKKSKSISPWRGFIYFVHKGIEGCRQNFKGITYMALMTIKEYLYILLINIQILWQRMVKSWRVG